MGLVQSVLRYGFMPIDYVLDFVQGRSAIASRHSLYLQGNFAPVQKEISEKQLGITAGELPPDLNGEFVRNGPNALYVPKGGYHWFDGDGMLHGVRIKNQNAAYVNRYVQTKRLQEESRFKRALYIRIGELRGGIGLLKIMLSGLKTKLGILLHREKDGVGTANTALTFHDGKLLALVEADHPYALNILQDGRFEQLGRLSYEKKLKHPMTAHPKIDPSTGELVFFGYKLDTKPYCSYSVISKEGKLLHTTEINISRPIMMHDFAITENYSLFLDFPLEFVPKNIIKGDVFTFNKQAPSRVGIIPRHPESKNDITWHEFENGFIFHTINAWEEGDEIVMMGCRSTDVNLYSIGELDAESSPFPHYYRINTKTGEKHEHRICNVGCEFPTIHPNLIGRKTRYAYCATFDPVNILPLFNGVVKIDLTKNEVVGTIQYSPNVYGGECVFVPKVGNDGSDSEREDEGYLLTFVYDENVGVSQFIVMDAKTMDHTPLTVITLPQRVPYGFHGIFVTEEQIEAQNKRMD